MKFSQRFLSRHRNTDPTTDAPRRQSARYLVIGAVGAVVLAVLGALGLELSEQRQIERGIKDRWERQVADVKSGKQTFLTSPEPSFLEDLVRDQPDIAAKITSINFSMSNVSDERFGVLKQFPHLAEIDFYDVPEGADSLLKRIAGMESITSLSFSKTLLSEDGVRAVASFPNLKQLSIDYSWKDTSLEPLRSHKSLETLVLGELPITKVRIDFIRSLPKLRVVDLEDFDVVAEADRQKLRMELPNVKIQHNAMR
jgi:hypothetical protein